MKKDFAPFHVDWNMYHLTLEKIPAWICRQCGEVYFEETEVDRIQDVLESLDQKVERIAESA
jgi:YgiT-type zinc finger domain-containing protein